MTGRWLFETYKHTGGIRHHRYAHTDARSPKKDVIYNQTLKISTTTPSLRMHAELRAPAQVLLKTSC